MTRFDSDPDLQRLGDALRASTTADLAREQQVAHASRREPGQAGGPGFLRRPRLLAGGTLGLVGIAAALLLAVTGTSAPPAFAVTRQNDGSVLVRVNVTESTEPWVLGADRKLAAMGIDEQIGIGAPLARGAASARGPLNCTPLGGANKPPGPPVKVLLGTDGTQVIPSGNTGAGTVHLSSCVYFKSVTPGGSGNTGNSGNTGAG
jgi:hypothetical protein